jgi:hypothetical protein
MGQHLINSSAITHAGIAHAAEALRWHLIQWCKEAEAMARDGAVVDFGCTECAQSTLKWMQFLAANWPGMPVDTSPATQRQLKREADNALQRVLSRCG